MVLLATLLLNNRKTNLVSENASPEGVKAEVPDRHHGGVLENVCPVQEQEDAPVKDNRDKSIASHFWYFI